MRVHCCQALGCLVALQRMHLMCPRHWALVPISIQVEITNSYRRQACINSPTYYEACAEAIEFVARHERVPTMNRYRSITQRFKERRRTDPCTSPTISPSPPPKPWWPS